MGTVETLLILDDTLKGADKQQAEQTFSADPKSHRTNIELSPASGCQDAHVQRILNMSFDHVQQEFSTDVMSPSAEGELSVETDNKPGTLQTQATPIQRFKRASEQYAAALAVLDIELERLGEERVRLLRVGRVLSHLGKNIVAGQKRNRADTADLAPMGTVSPFKSPSDIGQQSAWSTTAASPDGLMSDESSAFA